MKTQHYFRLFVVVCLITSLFSCERLSEFQRISDTTGSRVVQGDDETGGEKPEDPCGEPVIIRLVSTDNLSYSPASVTVTNDNEFLTVKFEITEGDLKFDMMYLQVGPLDLVPLDDPGTYPAFWEFDYKLENVSVSSQTFQIAVAELDDCFVILAQARVTDGQNPIVTWTEGTNPDWTEGPFYTYYCLENCGDPSNDPCDDPSKDPCDDPKKDPCDGCKMGIYRTQTPGGWGAKAAGNNPGAYRDANFESAFPKGLIVGDLGKYTIKLTSAKAIEKLLPTGGKPTVLTESYTDPDKIKNVLVGHLVALTLSVGFDDYDKDFGKADGHLKGLIIADGYGFDGMNIKDILKEANAVLGGTSSSFSPSQMTEILTKINEYFVDGKKSDKYKLFDCK